MMEYKKIINQLDNTPNPPSKLKQKNELKYIMTHGERTTQIANLKLVSAIFSQIFIFHQMIAL